jgi:hypothetical protein
MGYLIYLKLPKFRHEHFYHYSVAHLASPRAHSFSFRDGYLTLALVLFGGHSLGEEGGGQSRSLQVVVKPQVSARYRLGGGRAAGQHGVGGADGRWATGWVAVKLLGGRWTGGGQVTGWGRLGT